ncbi:hypothetical protein Avbf_16571 [Armadillidium vulgare]|nr:hypothetical protein Avbf_16571 [Armadillidium vulgare]
MVVIKMFDKQISHHFIRLCTGENGPSYRGALFGKAVETDKLKGILLVKNFIENGRKCKRVVDYNFSSEIKVGYKGDVDEMFVCMHPNAMGCFSILLSSKTVQTRMWYHRKDNFSKNIKGLHKL